MRTAIALAFIASLSGCGAAPDDAAEGARHDDAAIDDAPSLDAARDADAADELAPSGPCPIEMVWVEPLAICVDRWESQVELLEDGGFAPHSPYDTLDEVTAPTRAVSRGSVVPQAYISGEQAQAACEGADKRLCTLDEYRTACEGPAATTYPYGDTYVHGVCNEGRAEHPILELYGDDAGPEIWDSSHMNNPLIDQQPDTLAPTGAKTGCESGYGAFDMVGNLHEWVADPDGTFAGGYYVDAELNGHGCLYTTTAHAFGYHDYSTGFRCCLTP